VFGSQMSMRSGFKQVGSHRGSDQFEVQIEPEINYGGGPEGGPSKNGYYEEESMKEINSLNRFIRKFKMFTKLKEVIAKEKHEKELFNQRKRLTSNECLWEQLAEAEKREGIMR
jgi:hypothetical protein